MTDPDFKAQQREQPEPEESNRPVPKLVISVVAVLLVWAVYYLYAHYTPMPASLGDNRVAADFAVPVSADGGQLYTAHCVACHQANGQGLPGVFPPLSSSEWVSAEDPNAMIRIVLHGVQGPLTVGGVQYNGLMPFFHDKFSDEEMSAVINHVRTSFGNSAPQTDAAYVNQIRQQTAGQTTPWKGDEDLRPVLTQ